MSGARPSPAGPLQTVVLPWPGLGLAIAGEAALKLKETCLLAAEATSTAEFRHGWLALADKDTAALVFLLEDATRLGNEALIQIAD